MNRKRILIVIPIALVLALMPLLVLADGGPWSDNFDSYATGSQMHGQGGWKGWGNSVAFGALTSSTQAYSAPNSVDILGASDLVHEYTTASGQWTYTAWQYIPGNMQGVSYFIMLNQYDDPCANCNWSVQVNFDSISGLMTDDGSGSQMAYVPDQWVEIRVEIDLDADTQSFYYNGAALYTNMPWNGYITGVGTGSNAIGAVDLFANNATTVYYDDMSLSPPFVAEPGIDVSKSPDSQDITSGGNADFTIGVTNTGNITLSVTLSDTLVPACDNALGDLGPGASTSYTCTDVGVTSSYTNTITATGSVAGAPPVEATDTAVVTVTPPTSVSLSGFGGDDATLPTGLVVAVLGMAVAAGLFVVNKRRSQQI